MKRTKFKWVLFANLSFSVAAFSQNSFENVLQSVAQNNKTIIAQTELENAQRLAFRTGLNPENPFVEYDRLPGRPEGAGVQQEFSVTQQLDFPTAYGKRRQRATARQLQSGHQSKVVRQEVLLDAKMTCLQLIYLNKKTQLLGLRSQKAKRLLADVSEKLKVSDATALEVNKARLQSLAADNELRSALAQQRQLVQKLTELNGGLPLMLADTAYPAVQFVDSFARLDSLTEASDPRLAMLRQQTAVDETELALSKALTLPKLQVGYHYQSILGQRYQCLHFGLTLPLWENANTVRAAHAAIRQSESRLNESRNIHYSGNRQLYDQYLAQKQGLAVYEQTLSGLTSIELLDNSLQLGQITVIEYILETSYLHNAIDTHLELERDLQLTLAELTRYQL